jgi:hypothetical protein
MESEFIAGPLKHFFGSLIDTDPQRFQAIFYSIRAVFLFASPPGICYPRVRWLSFCT